MRVRRRCLLRRQRQKKAVDRAEVNREWKGLVIHLRSFPKISQLGKVYERHST